MIYFHHRCNGIVGTFSPNILVNKEICTAIIQGKIHFKRDDETGKSTRLIFIFILRSVCVGGVNNKKKKSRLQHYSHFRQFFKSGNIFFFSVLPLPTLHTYTLYVAPTLLLGLLEVILGNTVQQDVSN